MPKKEVKKYQRSSLSKEKLNALSLLCLESELMKLLISLRI